MVMAKMGIFEPKGFLPMLCIAGLLFAAALLSGRLLDIIDHGTVIAMAHDHAAFSLLTLEEEDHGHHHLAAPDDHAPSDEAVPHHHRHSSDGGSAIRVPDVPLMDAPLRISASYAWPDQQFVPDAPIDGHTRPPRMRTANA